MGLGQMDDVGNEEAEEKDEEEEERVDRQQQRGRSGGGFILGRGAAVDGGRHDVCFHGDGLSVSYT